MDPRAHVAQVSGGVRGSGGHGVARAAALIHTL